MMRSTKCLDLNYFELHLDTFFRRNNFSKRLSKIFGVLDREPLVTLGYEVIKVFSFQLFRIIFVPSC